VPDQTITQLSSADPTATAILPGVVNSTTQKFELQEAVGYWSTVAGDMVYANGARTLTRLAPGTSHSYLRMSTAGTAPQWVPRQWGQSVGWKSPATSDIAMFEVPFNLTVSSFAIVGDSAGSVTIEVRLEAFSSTPAASAAQVSSNQPVSLSNAQRNSSAIASWSNVSWNKGQWVTLYVNAPSSLTFLSVSLVGTERSS